MVAVFIAVGLFCVAGLIWTISTSQGNPLDISDVHTSGVLSKGEEVKNSFIRSVYTADEQTKKGIIVLTNKRFLFLKKPPGENSHGADLVLTIPWRDVLSVSISDSNVNITAKNQNLNSTYVLRAKKTDPKTLMEAITGCKNGFIDETVIEAKTVIIEEGNKDKAAEILQKRLARGEITLDEFHKKIQRT